MNCGLGHKSLSHLGLNYILQYTVVLESFQELDQPEGALAISQLIVRLEQPTNAHSLTIISVFTSFGYKCNKSSSIDIIYSPQILISKNYPENLTQLRLLL